MQAWGQIITHLLHWMHVSGSHTGISRAMLRFSYWQVPVGKVPSTGIMLTGTWSPRPPAISPRTSRTKAGMFLPWTDGGISIVLVTVAGTWTWWRFSRVLSTAARFF